MTWVAIHAGKDHLQQFSLRPAVDALAELVWNGLDAEADVIDVDIHMESMIDHSREMTNVTRVTVTDNGHGMTPERANEAFASLGDSWKRSLNGRTVNDKRALHGRHGRGRFFAYSLGHRARWTTVASVDDAFVRFEITGDERQIDGFTVGEARTDPGPAGTTVVVDVEQGRSLPALKGEDLTQQVAARLAAHLLGNKDITVRVNGQKVDLDPLIEGAPIEHLLSQVPAEDLGGREVPVLLLVDWTDEMRSAPGVVLCTLTLRSLRLTMSLSMA